MTAAIRILLEALLAFFTGTVFFDVIHYVFHQCFQSKNKILKKIGNLHITHHRFYSRELNVQKNLQRQNMINHLFIECFFQSLGIISCMIFLPAHAILLALLFQFFIFSNVCFHGGVDRRHRPYDVLPACKNGFLVCAYYHALHHVYPNKFFGSYVKLLDCVLGTAHQIRGKHIAMTGAGGALGSKMKALLEKEGAHITTFKYGVDYTYDDYEKLKQALKDIDILFLSHGTKYENTQKANCDSFVKIIELYKAVAKPRLVPIEIWAVGSEIECHPCFGIKKLYPYASSKRNFAHYARKYFKDRNIQYRHLVHSAFTSKMGQGLMSANFAAKATLFLIKRGFKYVPVTYTGFAFLNYFRFIF